MTQRRARLSLLVVAVATGMVAPAVGAAPGAAGAVAAPGAPPAGPTVTLLTGDKVTVGGLRGVSVQAAKGREHISFYSRKDERGDLHVVPSDAQALLSRGKLDPRLFDVTELVRAGYDDAHKDKLPLIVDYAGSKTPRIASAQVSRELPSMSAAAVSADRSADFWATAKTADHVWLDGPVRALLDQSVPQIGAPEAWAAGYTGAGSTVAVLDTGIDVTHPDLTDAVVGEQNFTDSDTTDDRFGHGTHVASIITGNGAKYKGVAPDAKLLNGKVLDDFGGGLDSWIIAGMEWAAHNADVVSMSLGDPFPSDGTDPMSQAVNRLTAETGALFVIAAGNSGYLVGSPGAADAALTVGAVDKSDKLAEFSSRGRVDGAIKPDITAPGVDIVAAKAKNGVIGDPAEDGYVKLSGTSMATPHVSGAAAILAGEHPDWTPEQLKTTLMGTAKPGDYTVFEQGAGRVDVAKAVTSTVSASPASLNAGTVQWPHDDDQPVTKTVTYTNTGTTPVTLDLSLDVKGPDAVPQGMFTLSQNQVTVPAGGQATVTVTTNTKIEAADGVYSGALTATGAGQSVRTPFAANREVESYNVTVKFIDHNGAPTDNYFARFVDVNTPIAYLPTDPSGTQTMRLPKGEYYFEASVATQVAEFDYHYAEFAEPAFIVDGDKTVVSDAREGKPAGFTLDKPNARMGSGIWQFALKTAWGDTGTTAFVNSFEDSVFKPSVTSKKDKFTFTAESRMAEWNGEAFTGDYLYNVRHSDNGVVPRNLQWVVHDRQLATVRSEYAVVDQGTTGQRENFLNVPLPGRLTEYYTPDVPWESQLLINPDNPVALAYTIEPRTYHRGRTTTERWNYGVFGPALPTSPYSTYANAGRLGDEMRFDVPMVTDQSPGRMGYGNGDGSTTLLKDGQVVGEDPYPGGGGFEVGPENAQYTLRTVMNRSDTRLSTQISAEWTFRSAHNAAPDPVALPLLALRFAPALDKNNAAPAGKRFTIPFSVQRNGTTEPGRVNTPTVEVSYDDGTTWQKAKVGGGRVTVNHPAHAQFVSLRSTVSDKAGNVQHLTVLRAYALK